MVPNESRASIKDALNMALLPAGVSQVTVDCVADLVLFIHAISLASTANPPWSITFDPHGFTEEWLWVVYQLLCYPGPLRDESACGGSIGERPIDCSALKTENYTMNHRVALTGPIIPAAHSNILEPAMRLASLLYMKEFIPDFPRNLGGYSILLTLLTYHLKQVLAECRANRTRHRAASSFLDSRLREHDTTHAVDSGIVAAMRPALVWICLLGNLVSMMADGNECRVGEDRYDRTIYRICVAEVVGVTPEDADALSEHDLSVCRMLDLKKIQGQTWDDRTAVKRLLAVGL